MLCSHSIKLVFVILIFCTSATRGQDYPGKLRLVNGTNTYSFAGRLEIYHNGRWNSICSYGFGYDDVVLACKQLGYRTYQRYGTVGRLGFRPASSSTPIWASYVSCNKSNPAHLTLYQCPRSSSTWCNHNNDVAVECSFPYSTQSSSVIFSTSKVDNSSDATFLTAGRVNIFFAGQWGSICSDGFTLSDAQGLCHIMTGSHSVMAFGAVGSDNLEFDESISSSPVWVRNFHCKYYSSYSRYFCEHDGLGNTSNCAHSKDLALSCLAEGATRLVSESSPSSNDPGGSAGRLEIYYDGQWGTVCDDSFDQTDADVVCKQLGYIKATKFGNVGELGYSQATGNIWLTNVRCTSDDIFLANCSHSGLSQVRSCSHSEDVAISCLKKSTTSSRSLSVGALAGIIIVVSLVVICLLSVLSVVIYKFCTKKRTNNSIGRSRRTTALVPPTTSRNNNISQHYQSYTATTSQGQVAPPPYQTGAPHDQQRVSRYPVHPTDMQHPRQELPQYSYPAYGQYIPPPAQISPALMPQAQLPPPHMPQVQMPSAQNQGPTHIPPDQIPPAQMPPVNQCTPVQGSSATPTAPAQQQHWSNPAVGGLTTYYYPFRGEQTN